MVREEEEELEEEGVVEEEGEMMMREERRVRVIGEVVVEGVIVREILVEKGIEMNHHHQRKN